MRLEAVFKNVSPERSEVLARIKDRVGFEPGPFVTMSYCYALFGKHWAESMEQAMCRSRCWRRGDVELFAAYISKLNACAY